MIADGGGDDCEGEEEEEHEGQGQANLHLSEGERPAALNGAHEPPPHADGSSEAAVVVAGQTLPGCPCALRRKDEAPDGEGPACGGEQRGEPAVGWGGEGERGGGGSRWAMPQI